MLYTYVWRHQVNLFYLLAFSLSIVNLFYRNSYKLSSIFSCFLTLSITHNSSPLLMTQGHHYPCPFYCDLFYLISKFLQNASGKFCSKLTSFHLPGVSDLFFFSLYQIRSGSAEAWDWVEPSGSRDIPEAVSRRDAAQIAWHSLVGVGGSLKEGKFWFVVHKKLHVQSWSSEAKPREVFAPMSMWLHSFLLGMEEAGNSSRPPQTVVIFLLYLTPTLPCPSLLLSCHSHYY